MTSARVALAEHLRATLSPDIAVTPAAVEPDGLTRTTVLLWQDEVTRMGQIGHDRLSVQVVVWLLVPDEDPERAEGALETGLDRLIDALRPILWADWQKAERMTFGNNVQFHGYKLTLTVLATIGE